MTALAGAVGALAALALAASFAGMLHPAGDSLAVFRAPLAGVLALSALLAGGPGWGAAALVVGAAALAPQIAPRLARGAPGPFVHYQQNLRYDLATPERVLADIAAAGPDTITLQEVSARNRETVLEPLRASHPHQAFCEAGAVGGVAVASRWPILEAPGCGAVHYGGGRGPEGDGLAALRVDAPGGPLWVASVHLTWPWPEPQALQAATLVPRLAALGGDVLLAGDFNMVRWSHRLRALARAARARVAGHAPITFVRTRPPVPLWLAIDHVLVPEGARGRVEARPDTGSDHRALVLRWSR